MNQTTVPICEKCNSEMWDNRPKKASGQFKSGSPDFKCKNDQCGNAIWPQKAGKGQTAGEIQSNQGQQPQSNQQPTQNNQPQQAEWPTAQEMEKRTHYRQNEEWRQKNIQWQGCWRGAIELVTHAVFPYSGDLENLGLHVKSIADVLFAQAVRMPRVTTDMMAGRTGDPGPQQPPGY